MITKTRSDPQDPGPAGLDQRPRSAGGNPADFTILRLAELVLEITGPSAPMVGFAEDAAAFADAEGAAAGKEP